MHAAMMLGYMYCFGEGVTRDNEVAFKLILFSASGGHRSAQFFLGHHFYLESPSDKHSDIKSNQEAFRWIKRSAEQGLPRAQFTLGVMLSNGSWKGVKENRSEAVQWLSLAAGGDPWG